MSSKVEILAQIVNHQQYIGSYVKTLINSVHCEDDKQQPSVFKKGDTIQVRVQQDGSSKPRPAVIIKVTKDYLVSIPLTSVNDENALCVSTGSRFFKEGYFCNTYVVTPIDKAVFLNVYDSKESLNRAIRNLKLFINKNI